MFLLLLQMILGLQTNATQSKASQYAAWEARLERIADIAVPNTTARA